MRVLPRSAHLFLTATLWWGEFVILWFGFRSQPQNLWLAALLGFLAAAAQVYLSRREDGVSGVGLDLLVYSISLVLFGLPETALVILLSCLAAWLWRRDSWQVAFFNIGRFATAAWVSSLVIKPFVLTPGVLSIDIFVTLALPPLVFVLVNRSLGGLFIWLVHGMDMKIRESFDYSSLAGEYSLMTMGSVFALLWQVSPAASILALVPVILGARSLRQPLLPHGLGGSLESKHKQLDQQDQQIEGLNTSLLATLAEAIDLRDSYTLGHSQRVSHYGVQIANQMGLSAEIVNRIRSAGLLHDIGKLGIRDELIFKPGELTSAEYEVVKLHTTLGARMLEKSSDLKEFAPIVRYHHERYDGQGYPHGLAGTQIPLESRIISVADAIEAMTSIRPHRQGSSISEVVAELQTCSGAQFDPSVIAAFCALVDCQGESLLQNTPVGAVDQAIPVEREYFLDLPGQPRYQPSELRLIQ